MIRVIDGDWKTQDDFTHGWDELIMKMNSVKQDMTMDEFLKENFNDEKYTDLRTSVCVLQTALILRILPGRVRLL